jgi:cell division transport system ATP-binding protein
MTTVFAPPGNTKTQQRVASNDWATQMPVMIRLQGVTKTYPNGSRGLLDVNLEVNRGDFLFVTGLLVLGSQRC